MLKHTNRLIAFMFALFASASFAAEVQPAIKSKATAFPLSAVKLLDGPFKHAMDVDKDFLLRLDPDRFLAGFRSEAGLPKKAEPYNNPPSWEAIRGTNRYTMAGHSLGHYLSALSQMAAATGDAECKRRANYIVDELAACQKASGSGILCAFPDSKGLFAEIARGQIKTDHLFGLNGGYVPLYSAHKVMAGLRDNWLLLGNQTARDAFIRQLDWLNSVFEKLTDDQVQEVLETEQGGILESAADAYALTGDAKFLALAKRINHKKFYEPLVRAEDRLTRQHANAQIPKVIGMERLYELTGEKDFGNAARFFWDNVVNTRSFVIGGHGTNEFFFGTNEFDTKGINSTDGPETCNTYNMLKLSRQLWLVEPSVPIADFVERALYNHILPSQDPDKGGFAYFTPMRPGHYRVYCNDSNCFWCCTGTGMENHARYGEYIFAHQNDKLWVDLLIPSELNWADQGATVKLDTRFPENGKATLTFTLKEPRKLSIALRSPSWLKPDAMTLSVNGTPQKIDSKPGAYVVVERTWKTGDKLEVDWSPSLRTEFLPGSTEWVAFLWGPVVLAGRGGTEGLQNFNFNSRNYKSTVILPVAPAASLGSAVDDVIRNMMPVSGKPANFHIAAEQIGERYFSPFYEVHRERYTIYWHLSSAANR